MNICYLFVTYCSKITLYVYAKSLIYQRFGKLKFSNSENSTKIKISVLILKCINILIIFSFSIKGIYVYLDNRYNI